MTTSAPDPIPDTLDADSESPDLHEDPDDDLELREDFAEEMRASLEAAADGRPTRSADEVAQRLGLSW